MSALYLKRTSEHQVKNQIPPPGPRAAWHLAFKGVCALGGELTLRLVRFGVVVQGPEVPAAVILLPMDLSRHRQFLFDAKRGICRCSGQMQSKV